MLDTGTKVIVLESSLNGKTGPKKGSIGYITRVDQPGLCIYAGQNKFADIVRVVFDRYGFEKNKNRREVRTVINVIPFNITGVLEGRTNFKKWLRSVSKIENDKGVQRAAERSAILYNETPVCICALAPINYTTDLSEDKEEFKTWLQATLLDKQMKGYVANVCNILSRIGQSGLRNKLSSVLGKNTKIVVSLLDFYRDKQSRLTLMEALSDGRGVRKQTIYTLRQLGSIMDRASYNEQKDSILSWISQNDLSHLGNMEKTADILLRQLFNHHELIWKSRTILSLKHADKCLMSRICNHMISLRSEIVGLGQLLELQGDYN